MAHSGTRSTASLPRRHAKLSVCKCTAIIGNTRLQVDEYGDITDVGVYVADGVRVKDLVAVVKALLSQEGCSDATAYMSGQMELVARIGLEMPQKCNPGELLIMPESTSFYEASAETPRALEGVRYTAPGARHLHQSRICPWIIERARNASKDHEHANRSFSRAR